MVVILSAAPAAFATAEAPVPLVPVIVRGEMVIEPTMIDGYESTRETANIVHSILGRANPDVTLRPAGLRTGTMRLVFADEFQSIAAEEAHAEGGVFTLTSEVRMTVIMDYVPVGRITRTLDDQTRDVWILSIDFQEVDG